MVTADYEIVVDGELPPDFDAQLTPARISLEAGRTIVSVHGVDQAALHGILNRVADLGLTLLEVRPPAAAVDGLSR